MAQMLAMLLRQNPERQPPTLSNQQICKATISAIMGRPVDSIKSRAEKSGYVFTSYIRADDGEKFEYECDVRPNIVIWRTKINGSWGRWRNLDADGSISYSSDGATLTINDSLSSSQRFSIRDLK